MEAAVERYNAFYGRFGPTTLPEAITHTTWSRFFDAYEPVHAMADTRDEHRCHAALRPGRG